MENVRYGSPKGTLPSDNLNIIKCALIGDGMVGKTSLLYSYTHGKFLQKYTATVLEKYIVPLVVGEEEILLNVYDTAGQNDFEEFRVEPYLESDVIVLCFSVCDVESFSNILRVWMPEIKQYIKRKLPVILIGTQADLRGHDTSEVAPEDALKLAKLIRADAYVECSAATGNGLNNVFNSVLQGALRRNQTKNSFLKRLLKR